MRKLAAYGKTDIGRKRSTNQDSILCDLELEVFAVADGMGGHKGGEIASAMVLDIIRTAVTSIKDRSDNIRASAYLKEAISLASSRVYERALMDTSLKGMGTTLVLMYMQDYVAHIAQVGDSRVYLIRDGGIWRITEDHSLVNEQYRAGILSREQAEKSAYRNVITRSVGFDEMVNTDIYIREIKDKDLFLLCSDGLTSMLKDEEIRDSVDPDDLIVSVDRLISLANQAGGNDNISVILVRVG
ncbi:MAG: Stp1/IreP family PP2C-type Ser/Thr phosphatase [Oligoflexia bacterium]|nr:Stp1/IreP family PP2C-type Ser/Thr phosphatase [Oligoflexia bacterium]